MRTRKANGTLRAWTWGAGVFVAAWAAAAPAATVQVYGGNAQALQLAVRSALPGDVVLVHPGEYRLTETLVLNRAVTLRGESGYQQTVLDGGMFLQCVRMSHPDAVLEGFTVLRGYAEGRGGGVEVNTGTVRHCYFTECYVNAGDGGGLCLVNSRIEGGTFKGNSANGRGGGVHATGSSVDNLVLHGNWGAGGGGGLFASAGQVIHCTAAVNGSRQSGAGLYAASGARVHNSILMYNWSNETPQHNVYSDGSCVFSHTCADPLPVGQGNIAADPLFEDVQGGNLQLRPDSPCRDAASSFFATARDVLQVSRPLDGNADGVAAPDMGAYEMKPGDDDGGGTWDDGYVALAEGWRWSWFGSYRPLGAGWHWSDRHGYFFVSDNSRPEAVFLFTRDMGWLFTSRSLYPYLYRFEDRAWLWYLRDSRNPRWFINLSASQWERR